MEKNRARLVRDFRRAPEVNPPEITGREHPSELLETAFPAYAGRQVRTAFRLMKRGLEEGAAVFLTLSGSMTPAGIHQSCLIPMIRRGWIDCITTTGANLYHDAHRVLGQRIREIDPDTSDVALRLARVVRIYDLGMDEDALLQTDKLFSWLLQKPVFQRKMTTPEFHYLLGRELYLIEKSLGVEQPSLLSVAYKQKVPIFSGAVPDSEIFLSLVKLKRLLGDTFKLEIDIAEDVFAMAAVQFHCFSTLKKKTAIWSLGGGVPKNYTLQGGPLLDRILRVRADGFDSSIQLCEGSADHGAISGSSAGEEHTWGRISQEGIQQGSVFCRCDVTAVFPWITYALLSGPAINKEPLRLYEQLAPAINELQRQVDRQRTELAKTLSFHIPRGDGSSKRGTSTLTDTPNKVRKIQKKTVKNESKSEASEKKKITRKRVKL